MQQSFLASLHFHILICFVKCKKHHFVSSAFLLLTQSRNMFSDFKHFGERLQISIHGFALSKKRSSLSKAVQIDGCRTVEISLHILRFCSDLPLHWFWKNRSECIWGPQTARYSTLHLKTVCGWYFPPDSALSFERQRSLKQIKTGSGFELMAAAAASLWWRLSDGRSENTRN